MSRSKFIVPSLATVILFTFVAISRFHLAAQTPPGTAVGKPPATKDSVAADNQALHPLDPLTPDEIRLAVATVNKERKLGQSYRFVTVTLNEPPKALVLHPEDGKKNPREARLVLLDRATGTGYEATVNLTNAAIERFEALPKGVQPPIMMDEFGECEETAKKSPAFREAMRKRGIDDVSLVMVDAWSAGHYGNEPVEDRGRRLVRTLSWARTDVSDNGYAHPIEGVVTVIDLNRKDVVRVEDHGVVPIPQKSGNWTRSAVPKLRSDLEPLEVSQPHGPSVSVRGQEIRWQKWAVRVGFNPREGLVLNTASYDGRPVLYRGSIAEMLVPYGDPKESAYRKNVFDLGEYGVGMLANTLAIGCDCLGTTHYFDGHLADNQGRVVTIKNAICVHEEDFGLLWKHTDGRTGQSEVRRSRRLAISMIANVGNYDYGFYWYFYQDGTIQVEMKLTGIVNTQALKPGEKTRFGTEVSPGLNAPYHQHFFNARLDMDIDGEANTVQEVNTRSAPPGPENPYGGSFFTEVIALEKESIAQRNTNPLEARFWRVVNPSKKNAMNGPVGYRLCPGENVLPHALPSAAILKRAAFLTKNLWVTPYQSDERYPAGEYPNQSVDDTGLPRWTKSNRNLANEDVVLWYTFGQTHIPRLEDWPVMPVTSLGFSLKPDGFFNANPALDVAPPRE